MIKPSKFSQIDFVKVIILCAYSLITSFWFSKNQIWSLCQGLPECGYPLSILFLTFIKSFTVSILCYTIWNKIVNFCVKEEISPRLALIIFSPIILLLFDIKILLTFELILLLSIILIISKNKIRLNYDYLIDAIYLLFLIWILLIFCEPFSPLYYQYSTSDLRGDLYRLPFFSEFFKTIIWAKHFSFSGMDYSNWAAVTHSPIPSPSLLFQFLILLLDLPSLDVISFYRILLSLIFALCVIGSFSFYLLTYYGLKFNRGLAFLAGASFIFGNYRFLLASSKQNEGDGYIFLASCTLLPLALFLFTLALRKKSHIYSALSGIILALPPFILSTHPEAIIFSTATYFTVTFFSALLHDDATLKIPKKLALCASSFLAFLALFAFYLLPILLDILDGNMSIYGHKNSHLYAYQIYFVKDYLPFLFIGITGVLCQLIFKRKLNGFIFGSITIVAILGAIISSQPGDLIYRITAHFVSLHIQAYFRSLMFMTPLAIMIGLYGVNLLLEWVLNLLSDWRLLSSESRLLKFFAKFAVNVVIALLFFQAHLFPMHPLYTVDKSYNCPYYITLQSNLANYLGLSGDRANLPFIKNRLEKFESDLAKNKNIQLQSYAGQYQQVLEKHLITTAKNLPENQVIGFSNDSYKIIDDFYLNKNLNCVNPLLAHSSPQDDIKWEKSLWYNLDGIYYGLNKNFERIVQAKIYDDRYYQDYPPVFGIGNGYLMHNNTLASDSRFVISYPTIHSLYLTPNHYQNIEKEFRQYFYDEKNSSSRNFDIGINQKNMKFFNIAGIDIITTAKSYKNGPDLLPIKFSHHKIFGYEKDFALFRNRNSYGSTYIAGSAELVEKDLVKNSEKKIKDYFHEALSFDDYVKTIKKLQEPIEKITKKHDIVVEDQKLFELYKNNKRSEADVAEIRNIAGNKIFIKANCAEEKCLLGFNMAAFPYWKAFVNEDRTEIYRINLAFMGVEIPKGENGILFICENYLTNDLLFLVIVAFLIGLVNYRVRVSRS